MTMGRNKHDAASSEPGTFDVVDARLWLVRSPTEAESVTVGGTPATCVAR
jgi:hypothetical protein